MSHPFKIGGAYRNRHGDYEVVKLDGPRMVIQYADGRRLETTVKLQARIWKNIQAEERIRRSRGPKPGPVPPPKGKPTTQLGRLVERNLEHTFIAYAFSYIEKALAALKDAPPGVEAVIVQPYFHSRIVAARDVMRLYRDLTDEQIPILFTPQTRHREQHFAYGSRLLDLIHKAEVDTVQRNVDAGRWLVWDENLYANNFLIVKTPIKELADTPPVQVAMNLLSGPSQGEPVGAVSIPAPKILGPAFRHLLDDL